MLFRSLGCADSNDVSFVIFQDGVCQPFWSKWKTVFSLLLLQNLSNSSQNWLRWSLDRAAQKWLNRIFWLLVKKKVMMLWTTRSTQKLVHRTYLGQTLINWNETWYASSTPWSEDNMPKLGTAPPMGREIPKMHIFRYNFWKCCPNVLIIMSLHFGSQEPTL